MRFKTLYPWAFPIFGLALMFIYAQEWRPWQRLLVSTVGLLYLLKVTILLKNLRNLKNFSCTGLLLFMTVWPGMDLSVFKNRNKSDQTALGLLGLGSFRMCLGLVCVFLLAVFVKRLDSETTGWLGTAALLLTIHLGYSDVLTALMRLGGWPVRRLFDSPFLSRSLREFWGKRWNSAFIEMDHILFFQPLKQKWGQTPALAATFMISGLLHEMGVSYPVWNGWGLPLLYFILQAAFVILESRWTGAPSGFLRRLMLPACVLLPLPLLFHDFFRGGLIVPFYQSLNRLLAP